MENAASSVLTHSTNGTVMLPSSRVLFVGWRCRRLFGFAKKTRAEPPNTSRTTRHPNKRTLVTPTKTTSRTTNTVAEPPRIHTNQKRQQKPRAEAVTPLFPTPRLAHPDGRCRCEQTAYKGGAVSDRNLFEHMDGEGEARWARSVEGGAEQVASKHLAKARQLETCLQMLGEHAET